MPMKIQSTLKIVLLFTFAIIICSKSAIAGCTLNSLGTLTANFGTINVPLTAAPGTVIATINLNVPPGIKPWSCTDRTAYTNHFLDYSSITSSFSSYQTGLQGVAINAIYINPGDSDKRFTNPVQTRYAVAANTPLSGGYVTVNLVKTYEPVVSGTLRQGTIATIFGDATGYQNQTFLTVNMGTTTIVSPTCNVESPNLNVDLGVWDTSALSGVGSTTADVPLTLSVNCTGVGVPISATISGDEYSALPGTIKVNSTSTSAHGVGIQLADDAGKPLLINKKFSVRSSSSSGINNIDWKSHYIQTDANVTAGDANASVTVSFEYN